MDKDTELTGSRTTASRVLFVAAIVMASLNLRPAMASLAPLIETIRLDLSLSYTALGLLTTIPVVCLAIFPVAANRLAGRIGIERALVLALVCITFATAARLAGHHATVLFLSAFVVGLGVAGAQVYVPAIAKRHFGTNASFVTALYASTMSASAVIVLAATPRLTVYLGSWTAGLAIWSIPALLAVVLWIPIARDSRPLPRPATIPAGLPWRDPIAWRITSFSTVTFLSFFSILAWYAPIYLAQGWSDTAAGWLMATLFAAQLVSALAVTVSFARHAVRRLLMVLGMLLSVLGLAGAAFVPLDAPWVWAISTGLGLGVQFTLALTLPVEYGGDPEEVGRLTAMAMSVGYLLAAIGPVAVGWLRDLTGSFEVPIAVLAALVLILTLPALQLPAIGTKTAT
jgi:CP family cyanate transporter-like MFS transporter